MITEIGNSWSLGVGQVRTIITVITVHVEHLVEQSEVAFGAPR